MALVETKNSFGFFKASSPATAAMARVVRRIRVFMVQGTKINWLE